MKYALTALAIVLAGSHPLLADPLPYEILTGEHVDLKVGYQNGSWFSYSYLNPLWFDEYGNLLPDAGEGRAVAPGAGLLYNEPSTIIPSGVISNPAWAFLGAVEGEDFYLFPQGQEGGNIFLGFGSENVVTPGTFAKYVLDDPRSDNPIPTAWTRISLVGLRFTPDPTDESTHDAHFSLWTLSGTSTTPDVWMSTYLDGVDEGDYTWLNEGGHIHYNWGFTRKGYYELDFQFSAYLADDGSYIESEVFTYHIGAGYLPPELNVIPEPSAVLLLGAGALGGLLHFRKRRRTG